MSEAPVSVVIRAKDEAASIGRTLELIERQTVPALTPAALNPSGVVTPPAATAVVMRISLPERGMRPA